MSSLAARSYALAYRNSLSILKKVGQKRNLQFLSYSARFSRFAGAASIKLSFLGAGISTVQYGKGNITSTTYAM